MPTTQRLDDDDDDRPAFGLRDDDFDDRLRARKPLSPKETEGIRRRYRVAAKAERSTDEDREAREEAEAERKDERRPYQLRKHEKFAKDPADWLAIPRMTQTEVGSRLAQFLISNQLVSGPVTLTLAGYELTRRDKPQFPIDRYLVEDLRFIAKDPIGEECSGTYIMKDRPHALVISWNRLDGHLITHLASGQRLVVFVSAGKIVSTRNPSDHKQLRNVIGRAMTWPGADALDFLAVCVPRSVHYLELCKSFRDAEGVTRARIALLNVDRHTGQVYGLPSLTDLIKS